MYIFRAKAKRRLDKWNLIRKEKARRAAEEEATRLEIQAKKDSAMQKLMDRYDIPSKVSEMYYAYRGDDECYPYVDEDGDYIEYSVGDLMPYKRRGDIVFFYEITNSKRKFGDYGYSNYATFYDLEYHHSEKIPEQVVDPSKSLAIKWDKVSSTQEDGINEGDTITTEYQKGSLQGIEIVELKIKKRRTKTSWSCYTVKTVEAKYINHNFSDRSSLPSYYDNYFTVTEAKKEIQTKVRQNIKGGGTISKFYIEPKFRGRE